MRLIKGMIYTDRMCFEPGGLFVEEDHIEKIERYEESTLTEKERETYVLPGLMDIHFHGCAGYDVCDGTMEAIREIASYELAHGVTTICPTTMTLSEERLTDICEVCLEAVKTQTLESGVLLKDVVRGIYLEGPFVSLEKKGAQNPAYIQKADLEMLKHLQQTAGGLLRVVAIAPETEGAMAHQVTHLYNAMPPFTHRAPGVIGAAAEDERTMVELICDGLHIHPSVVKSTFKLFGAERVILISDSMKATGLEDGEYALGGQPVTVKGNLAVLRDGTIAASVTNLYDCMRTAIRMGVPKEAAVRAASYNPAKAVGLESECGVLAPGRKADILLADREFALVEVIKAGRVVKV